MSNIHQFRKSEDSKRRVAAMVKDNVAFLRETDARAAKQREEAQLRRSIHEDVEWHLRRLWAFDGENNAILTVDMILANIKLGPK